MKKALICRVGGQDGAFLARMLLEKGYEVHGTSRDAWASSFPNLRKLGILDRVRCHFMATNDFRSVLQILAKIEPDEIYNLSGQNSVGLSFDQPVETRESIGVATLNLLEAVRFMDHPVRFYNASSSECFGDVGDFPTDESTPFRPQSPYAVAKAAAHWEVANYREAYNLFACSGILFNHESHLRPERFVTRKIVASTCRIARGQAEPLVLGNLSISRDWGWAPEYVEAMWKMLQHDHPEDFVIATGQSHSIEHFTEIVFSEVGLDWHEHVRTSPEFYRPSDLKVSRANLRKADELLGWRAETDIAGTARRMVGAELEIFGSIR